MRIRIVAVVAVVALVGVAHAENKTVVGEKFGAYCGRFDPKRPLSITFLLKREALVDGIRIVGRNSKSVDAATAHGRVAALTVVTDGDNRQSRPLPDVLREPAVSPIPGRPSNDDGSDLPEAGPKAMQNVPLMQVTTKRVTVVIDRIIPGTRYKDVCVGSIEVIRSRQK